MDADEKRTPCEACDGRGWVHGECNYRPGGSERCQGWMDVLGYSKCAEPWPCPLCSTVPAAASGRVTEGKGTP